jgi:hypothetical protein
VPHQRLLRIHRREYAIARRVESDGIRRILGLEEFSGGRVALILEDFGAISTQILLITGSAGIGKSSLVNELLKSMQLRIITQEKLATLGVLTAGSSGAGRRSPSRNGSGSKPRWTSWCRTPP